MGGTRDSRHGRPFVSRRMRSMGVSCTDRTRTSIRTRSRQATRPPRYPFLLPLRLLLPLLSLVRVGSSVGPLVSSPVSGGCHPMFLSVSHGDMYKEYAWSLLRDTCLPMSTLSSIRTLDPRVQDGSYPFMHERRSSSVRVDAFMIS